MLAYLYHAPVIHDASGAFSGLDNIAAQKYGPPEVGCALLAGAFSFLPACVACKIRLACKPLSDKTSVKLVTEEGFSDLP